MEPRPAERIVGLIGVGLLGSAMAERWLQSGWDVVAYDLDAERTGALKAAGGRIAQTSLEVADAGRVVVLSLPDSDVVAQVVNRIEPYLTAGQVVIDTTTGSPVAAPAMAQRLGARHVAWLDATVAGSSQQMSAGEAVLLVGGDHDAFGQVRDLLESLTAKIYWLGPSGSGARMKLVVNLAIGLHRAVLAEALALAQSFGFDASQALEVLKSTPAYSRAMDVKGIKMVERDFEPQARLAQHLKDVELILQAGRQHGQRLPLSELHRQILQSCVERGDGGLDNSAVIRAWLDDLPSEPA